MKARKVVVEMVLASSEKLKDLRKPTNWAYKPESKEKIKMVMTELHSELLEHTLR